MKEKTLWQQWEAARREGRLGEERKQTLASALSKSPALRLVRMKFCDYRCCSSLSTTFDHQLTVFHGGNGRGKSSVLEAAAKALSWGSAGMTGANDRGASLSAEDVRVPAAGEAPVAMAEIETTLDFGGEPVTGVLRKSCPGGEKAGRSEVQALQSLGTLFRVMNSSQSVNRPLFLYFSTDRSSWYRAPVAADEVNRMTTALSDAAMNRGSPALTKALKEAKSPAQFWGWLLYYSRRRENEDADVAQEAAKRLEAVAAVLRAFWPAFEKISLETDTGVERLTAVIGGRRLLPRQFSGGEHMVFFLLEGELEKRRERERGYVS